MIEPKQVITESTSNGVSAVYCAQWYPNVVAQMIPAIAADKTLTATLKGSMVNDIDKAVTCAIATLDHDDDAIPQKLVKPDGEYWLFYWLVIETADANATIEEAYIGAGGT
jgi:hypothetical protein